MDRTRRRAGVNPAVDPRPIYGPIQPTPADLLLRMIQGFALAIEPAALALCAVEPFIAQVLDGAIAEETRRYRQACQRHIENAYTAQLDRMRTTEDMARDGGPWNVRVPSANRKIITHAFGGPSGFPVTVTIDDHGHTTKVPVVPTLTARDFRLSLDDG